MVKKIEFSKSFPIWLIFCTGGFFGMGNSNPKEFFDFDHGKVPHTRVKPKKGVFSYYEVPLCKPFFDHILEVYDKN